MFESLFLTHVSVRHCGTALPLISLVDSLWGSQRNQEKKEVEGKSSLKDITWKLHKSLMLTLHKLELSHMTKPSYKGDLEIQSLARKPCAQLKLRTLLILKRKRRMNVGGNY